MPCQWVWWPTDFISFVIQWDILPAVCKVSIMTISDQLVKVPFKQYYADVSERQRHRWERQRHFEINGSTLCSMVIPILFALKCFATSRFVNATVAITQNICYADVSELNSLHLHSYVFICTWNTPKKFHLFQIRIFYMWCILYLLQICWTGFVIWISSFEMIPATNTISLNVQCVPTINKQHYKVQDEKFLFLKVSLHKRVAV